MSLASSLNAYERQVDKEFDMNDRQDEIERELRSDFHTCFSTLAELGHEMPLRIIELKYQLLALCVTFDWEVEHKNEAMDFMHWGLTHLVSDIEPFQKMFSKWKTPGEHFDLSKIDLSDMFFLYVWHQDRKNADEKITECFDSIIELMAEHLNQLEEK